MAKPIGGKLDDELYARRKVLGERCERSPHWLMKKAIAEFVERKQAAGKERHLLVERWSRYQESGEGLSHDTVDSAAPLARRCAIGSAVEWLETLGTDK